MPRLALMSSVVGVLALSSCNRAPTSEVKADAITESASTTVQSLIPAARLDKIKRALPAVKFAKLTNILKSPQTLWYDHDTMTPSYQDSVGVNSNKDWPRLVAKGPSTNPAIEGLHDAQSKRWQFPFGATAGTDKSTNLKVINFLHLPHVGGKPVPVPIWTVQRNANRPSWMWVYPIGTTFGEVLFLDDNGELLPSEIRIRQRFADGWATNVYRPFPTAQSLAAAIKSKKPDWQSNPSLTRVMEHLGDEQAVLSKSLAGKAALQELFKQTAGSDQLPDFGDAALVKELLTTTPFSSSFDRNWKKNGDLKVFAPTSTSRQSIVPNNYEAGVIEVSDKSCMRCHKEAGRKVSEFYDGLYLYGEVWGKDGIFSFHPFDESEFNKLRGTGSSVDGYYDNRKMNPKLSAMGIFERYDAAKHNTALYPKRENP